MIAEKLNDTANVNNDIILQIVDCINSHKVVKEFKITDDKLIIEFEYELYFSDIEILNFLLKEVKDYKEVTNCEFHIDKKNNWNTVSLKLL
jgi:hypothetical protein